MLGLGTNIPDAAGLPTMDADGKIPKDLAQKYGTMMIEADGFAQVGVWGRQGVQGLGTGALGFGVVACKQQQRVCVQQGVGGGQGEVGWGCLRAPGAQSCEQQAAYSVWQVCLIQHSRRGGAAGFWQEIVDMLGCCSPPGPGRKAFSPHQLTPQLAGPLPSFPSNRCTRSTST
jgi:hypothetical protein